MTVSTTISKSGPYDGAGTTGPFLVDFRFLEDAHLRVVHTDADAVDTTLTLNVDYTVSGAGDETGTVTLTDPLPVGERLTIIRSVPATQEADYVPNDRFPAESHEQALDKLTMLVQQNAEVISRALVVSESDPSPSLVLPSVAARANRYLSFDNTGKPVSTTFDVDTIHQASQAAIDAAAAAAVSESNAADSENAAANSAAFAQQQSEFVGQQVAAVTPTVVRFSGDGDKTEFNLPSVPGDEANTQIYIDGVYQQKNTYDVLGSKIVFDEAPPVGVTNIEVVIGPSVQLQIGSAAGITMVGPDGFTHAMSELGTPTGSGLVGHSSALLYPSNSIGGAVNDFVAGVINTLAFDPLDPNYLPGGSIEYLLEDGFDSVQ